MSNKILVQRTLFQSLSKNYKNVGTHYSYNENIINFNKVSNVSNVSNVSKVNHGKEILMNALQRNKVSTVFGISGGAIMPLIDGFYNSKNTRLIVNSDEQCVGHAATGYAKSSNKTGVCLVTSGPGITNMITPMLDAQNDSTPMVVFSGQVPLSSIETNAFQEAPAIALTKQFTKWSYQVEDIHTLSTVIDKAFKIANEGKPGVVHIDIPKCVSYQPIDHQKLYAINDINDSNSFNENNIFPVIKTPLKYKYEDHHFSKIGDLINNAKRPIIMVGQGCKDASSNLTCLALQGNIPVTSTIHGTGIFDEHNSLSLRWCGMHGYAPANYALQEADLIIAIGSRFDDRTTGEISSYAPNAKLAVTSGVGGIIHCNINDNEINSVVESDYNFCMDSNAFLKNLNPYIKHVTRDDWKNEIKQWKYDFPFPFKKDSKNLHIEHVLDKIYKKTLKKDVVFTTGVGNHQMQAYQFIKSQYPGKILSSGSLGVMGAGLPYAIGAQLANPDKMIICIDGDSSFNMTLNDLKTIAEYNLPVKIAIMNNNAQMMVTIWEKLFFEERYTATINEKNPSYVALARSFGIQGCKCSDPSKLDSQLDFFLNYDKGPILMEFCIERDICLPLVKPGCALDDMVLPGVEDFSDITNKGLPPC